MPRQFAAAGALPLLLDGAGFGTWSPRRITSEARRVLCSEVQLVQHLDGYTDVKPLPCNRWSCDLCAPKRRRRLIAVAASGEPTAFLTLTVNPATGASPLDRRNLLHDAWTRLVKRIVRQFALEPHRRWPLVAARRAERKERVVRAITAKTPRLAVQRVPYLAFLERTAAGEPHLHILLRVPFIPQDWISEQMAEMIGAPIVDIRQVRSTKAAVFYVTKYVTKAPAQFGCKKRYWVSRGWEVNTPEPGEKKPWTRGAVGVRRIHFEEWQFETRLAGSITKLLPDGWLRIYPNGTSWDVWGDFRDPDTS